MWKSAGRASSLRVLPWHLPYNWGKSTTDNVAKFILFRQKEESWKSSVGKVTELQAERKRKTVRYSADARDFPFLEKFQTRSCTKTLSLAMDISCTCNGHQLHLQWTSAALAMDISCTCNGHQLHFLPGKSSGMWSWPIFVEFKNEWNINLHLPLVVMKFKKKSYLILTLTLRILMSYTYGAPVLDVSRSHTTTQHSR